MLHFGLAELKCLTNKRLMSTIEYNKQIAACQDKINRKEDANEESQPELSEEGEHTVHED